MDVRISVEQAVKCFTGCKKIYLRDEEVRRVNAFLLSEDSIFHVTGNPGTGKTATVRSILRDRNFAYVNYFSEPEMRSVLEKSKAGIIVIDEFDKYLEEKKQECLRLMVSLKNKNKKVITISNNLRMGNVRFRPYTAGELKRIMRMKMEDELGGCIMDEQCMEFLAKKHEKTGDLRGLFKAILNAISKKEVENTAEIQSEKCIENKGKESASKENSKNRECAKYMGKTRRKRANSVQSRGGLAKCCILGIKDFIENEKLGEKSIHHQIICKVKEIKSSKANAYKEYLAECDQLSIPHVTKSDFNMIFDMS